jgi:hypothetical protein
VTIDVLPDNALLEIFGFYKDDLFNATNFTWRWKTLTHVCRRWRHVVFGSPRRLNLRLLCTNTTPVSRLLHIWPPFPIIVLFTSPFPAVDKNGVENIIAALECRDRISNIDIDDIRGPELEKLVTVLHEPLPLLTRFLLYSIDESVPVLPETFLGGSAPRLQRFGLGGIPFPSFPKFILSSAHIVALSLYDIPNSGYISPKVMATCLTALPHLEFLEIEFRSLPSGLLQSSPPPLTRAALPALSGLRFSGASEYFEDFVARIDMPRLTRLNITFFMDLIFDIPRLRNFIDRTEGLKLFNQAAIEFSAPMIMIAFGLEPSPQFKLGIRCERLDWQLTSLTQIFSEQLPLLSHVEQLKLREFPWEDLEWKDDPDMDSSQWLELFRLFVAAQSLHVSEGLVSPVARALQDLTGLTATEVFPVLRTLFLEGLQPSGPVHEAIKSFDTARQLSHQPVLIQPWER